MGVMQYWMNVSLDLFIEGKEGEAGGGEWMRIGEQLHGEFNRRAEELTVAVEGRVIHEIMEDFWPTAESDETLEDVMRDYGRIWTVADKILVSNKRTEAAHNTRIVGGDDVLEQLAELRANTPGIIGVGGANLATQLLEAGLLDEILLFTHPVILGSGRPLFDKVGVPIELELLEHKVFELGVTMHRYAISRSDI